MFSKSAHKNSSRIIKIDDYSIIICACVTVFMVFVMVLLADFYSIKEPEMQFAISYIPRNPPLESRLVPASAPKTSVSVRRAAAIATPGKKEKRKAAVPPHSQIVAKKSQRPSPKVKASVPVKVPLKVENRLTTMRGGRHERYASIVFQFEKRADFEPPRIVAAEIRLRLKNTLSRLRPYRKYKTFDSWVRLEKAAGDLEVRIGVPDNFIKMSSFLMKTPHRLVVNLYDR